MLFNQTSQEYFEIRGALPAGTVETVVALRCVIPRATQCPQRTQYPFVGAMERPLLRAVPCARAWHDLTLHTAGVEIALR